MTRPKDVTRSARAFAMAAGDQRKEQGPLDEAPAAVDANAGGIALPLFAIVGARPVQAVGTADGGMDVLAYDWDSGDFVRDLGYLTRILLGDAEVDIVDSQAFQRAVAELRARRGDRNDP